MHRPRRAPSVTGPATPRSRSPLRSAGAPSGCSERTPFHPTPPNRAPAHGKVHTRWTSSAFPRLGRRSEGEKLNAILDVVGHADCKSISCVSDPLCLRRGMAVKEKMRRAETDLRTGLPGPRSPRRPPGANRKAKKGRRLGAPSARLRTVPGQMATTSTISGISSRKRCSIPILSVMSELGQPLQEPSRCSSTTPSW
jgi:hypothetical protein